MKLPKHFFRSLWPAFAMLLLILDAKTALAGAQEGVELCIRTVVPSLFPFLCLSCLVTGNLLSVPLPFLRPLGRLCQIPEGSECLLAVGLLGGYPVGAQCISQAYRSGELSRKSARRMLGFCSNAGPSFLFGILSPMFLKRSAVWFLWGIHILSAILTGIFLPGDREVSEPIRKVPSITASAPLETGIKAMASICGWIILFRVLLSFLERWVFWLLPKESAVLLSGLLELTNGCCQLSLIGRESARFVLASVMLAFGGICVWMQTVSVTRGLGTGVYLPGKGIQAGISFLLSYIIIPFLYPGTSINPWIILATAAGVSIPLLQKIYKSHSSFLLHQGV